MRNRRLLFLSAVLIFLYGIPVFADISDGLVGHWSFDDGQGTAALDSSSNGNNGLLTNGPLWTEGKIGSGALKLDGIDDDVTIGQVDALDMNATNALTVSVWVSPGLTQKKVVFSRGGAYTGASQEVYYLSKNQTYADRWDAVVSDGTNELKATSAANTVSFNQWQHLVMVWDGVSQTLKIYKNADVIASTSTTGFTVQNGTSFTRNTAIGMDARGSRYYFDGAIDDVRVYNRALSSGEVRQLYQGGFLNGACGAAATTYGLHQAFPNGDYCEAGLPNPANPQDPSVQTPSTWTCSGVNGGVNTSCTATRIETEQLPYHTFYVLPNGSNFNTGESESAPFLTLDYALTKVSPGDVIILGAGVYADDAVSKIDGTADKNITIKGAGPANTVITGKLTLKHGYYTLTDVKILNTYVYMYGSGASHDLIENNEFTGGTYGVYLSQADSDPVDGSMGPSFNTISHNTFYSMIGDSMVLLGGGHDNTVSFNTFKDNNGLDILHVWGVHQTISDNTFLGIASDVAGGNHADILQAFATSACLASNNIIFERNSVSDSTSQLGNLSMGTCPGMGNWTFRNNVFLHSRIQLNNELPDVKVYNNTVYDAPSANGFRFPASGANGQVYNNIFLEVGDTTNNGFYASGAGVTADYNIVTNHDGSAKNPTYFHEEHGINGGIKPDDIFVDYLNGDFRLKRGSLPIDRGKDLSTIFSDDKDQLPRPQGTAWDIGAYEFNTGNVCASNTYYVDFENGNDANDGSCSNRAWKHAPGDDNATDMAQAKVLKAADTVLFKRGVIYKGTITASASGLKVAEGSKASINLSGVFIDSTANFANVLAGDYVYIYHSSVSGSEIESTGLWKVKSVDSLTQLTLDGFNGLAYNNPELTYRIIRPINYSSDSSWGSGEAMISGQGTQDTLFNLNRKNNIRIANLKFQDTRDIPAAGCTAPTSRGAIWDGGVPTTEDIIVENNDFSNVWSAIATGYTAYSVYRNNNINAFGFLGILGATDFSLVENNILNDGTSAIRGGGQYAVIRYNIITDANHAAATACGNHADGIGPLFSPSTNPGSSKYGWIYGNLIYNTVEGIFLTNNNGGTLGWTIHSNILIGHTGTPDGLGSGDAAILIEGAPNTRIYNNVITGLSGYKGWIRALVLDEHTGIVSSNVEFVNNIIYSLDPSPIGLNLYADTLGRTEGNVYYVPKTDGRIFKINGNFVGFSDWQKAGYDNGGLSLFNVEPEFISAFANGWKSFDLKLASTSPVSSSPFNLGVNVRDQSRNLRTNWSRGAYEAIQSQSQETGNGDVSGDGRVTMHDAALLLRYISLGARLSDPQKQANLEAQGDFNGDGKIDMVDVVAIARKALGL